jgi:hypothetical protein
MERKQHDAGLDLDDYAKFASSLTSEQVDGFSRGELVGFDPNYVANDWYTLLLWSSLSQVQREQALGVGLPLAALNSEQAANIRQVVGEGIGSSLRAILPLLCGSPPSQPIAIRCIRTHGQKNNWRQGFGPRGNGQEAPHVDASYSIKILIGSADLSEMTFRLPTMAGM